MMIKSALEVWLLFHPTPGSDAVPDAVRVHHEISVPLPPGQTSEVVASLINMTVVPGLASFETGVAFDPSRDGLGSKIVKKTRLRAKVLYRSEH